MPPLFQRFIRDERGANNLEYALVMILVVCAIGIGATSLGSGLNALFANAAASLKAANLI
jgi:Flp pilus assembly pilin Flp